MIVIEITIPIKSDLRTEPMSIDSGCPILPLGLSLRRATHTTRIAFPTITHGMISGMAAIIGLPVITNDVIGVTTDKTQAQANPAVRTQIIRHALIIGPVI